MFLLSILKSLLVTTWVKVFWKYLSLITEELENKIVLIEIINTKNNKIFLLKKNLK